MFSTFRYKEKNVKARNEAKTYSKNVPSFLLNKPPKFIKYCLSRMEPRVEKVLKTNICFTNKVNGTVKSVDSNAVYKVSFVNMIPYCSYQDFSQCHWPCKHILAVSSNFLEYNWEQLNKDYTGQACFSLDDVDTTDEQAQHEMFLKPPMETSAQEKSAKQIRHDCLFHLKDITNSLYCIDDEHTLQEAEQMLLDMKTFITEKQPSVGSLPVRLTKRKRQKERQQKAKHKTLPCQTSELYEGAKCVPMDTVIDIPANETDNRAGM